MHPPDNAWESLSSRSCGSYRAGIGAGLPGDGTTARSRNIQQLPENGSGESLVYLITILNLVKGTRDFKICPGRPTVVLVAMHVAGRIGIYGYVTRLPESLVESKLL